MYGKLMSIPDFAMEKYMRLVTRWMPREIDDLLKSVRSGRAHPRDAKMKMAREITSIFYGEADASQAEEAFVRLFQKGDLPDNMPEYGLVPGMSVADVLVACGLAGSKGEARRLVAQRGVRLDGTTLDDPDAGVAHPGVLQAGKRRFVRIT